MNPLSDQRVDLALKAAVALLLALAAWTFNDLKNEVRSLSTRMNALEIRDSRIDLLEHRIDILESRKP